MIKIVADDKIPFLKGVLEPYARVIYLPGQKISRDILIDADALLIRTRTKCTQSLLKGTQVRFIGTATIGFDHIDTLYCEKNKITWTNAPGCNSSSVQQYVASALLSIASYKNFSLKDKTIGIIGVGNVGTKVEKFARTIGMKVLLNDPPRSRIEGGAKFVDLEDVLDNADIITVHVPLNKAGEDKTYHLFDKVNLKKMRKGVWFINSSRGEVVDSLALKELLDSGKPGGVVLDVWENEPDIDHLLMAKVFIATPHIAGYSTDGKANGTAMAVNALSRYFELPLNNWYPDNIPAPLIPEISFDCKGKRDEDILRESILHTYNISHDDKDLRSSPSGFEKLRGDYPLRREFTSFSVNLKGGNNKVLKILKELGFTVVERMK